ncbi:hypothetical protein LLH03_16025 [bacterium]|nr:hypothetical protein [bacterium]
MTDWRSKLEQYEHNREFYTQLDSARFADWCITGRFYAAVNLVEAVLLKERGGLPVGHQERTLQVQTHTSTKGIANAYISLKSLSERARYHVHYSKIAQEDLGDAERWFTQIEEQLSGCLKD